MIETCEEARAEYNALCVALEAWRHTDADDLASTNRWLEFVEAVASSSYLSVAMLEKEYGDEPEPRSAIEQAMREIAEDPEEVLETC